MTFYNIIINIIIVYNYYMQSHFSGHTQCIDYVIILLCSKAMSMQFASLSRSRLPLPLSLSLALPYSPSLSPSPTPPPLSLSRSPLHLPYPSPSLSHSGEQVPSLLDWVSTFYRCSSGLKYALLIVAPSLYLCSSLLFLLLGLVMTWWERRTKEGGRVAGYVTFNTPDPDDSNTDAASTDVEPSS